MLRPARDGSSAVQKGRAEYSNDPLRRWSEHSLGSWQGQLNGSTSKDIFQQELTIGPTIHQKVSREQALRCIALYRNSLRDLIKRVQVRASPHLGDREQKELGRDVERSRVLFAPTARMVDYQVGDEGLGLLVSSLLAGEQAEQLVGAIASGPPSGAIAWERPENKVELVASLVRVAVLGEGIKRRIRVGDELRGWIKKKLEEEEVSLNPRLGGVSAVGTVTARSLQHIPTMMALGGMPRDVSELLGPKTPIVGSHPSHETLRSLPVDASAVGNVSFLIPQCSKVLGLLLCGLYCNGRLIEQSSLSPVDCLVTGSSAVPGFQGLTPERITELGAAHDGVVLTGAQNLDSTEAIDEYCTAVQSLRLRGALIALLYSESKYPDVELEVFRRLRIDRCVDFFGLNAGEAGALVDRISRDAAEQNTLRLLPKEIETLRYTVGACPASDVWVPASQAPSAIVMNALALHAALRIPMVRVRGNSLDLAVLDGEGFAPDHITEIARNLTASRLLGNIKTALPSGLIQSPEDITQMFNFPEGRCMAALCMADDMLRQQFRYGLGSKELKGSLVESFYVKLPDNRYVIGIPPLTFFDRSGGTVSAGDVKDISLFLESIPLLRHGLRGWGTSRTILPAASR